MRSGHVESRELTPVAERGGSGRGVPGKRKTCGRRQESKRGVHRDVSSRWGALPASCEVSGHDLSVKGVIREIRHPYSCKHESKLARLGALRSQTRKKVLRGFDKHPPSSLLGDASRQTDPAREKLVPLHRNEASFIDLDSTWCLPGLDDVGRRGGPRGLGRLSFDYGRHSPCAAPPKEVHWCCALSIALRTTAEETAKTRRLVR